MMWMTIISTIMILAAAMYAWQLFLFIIGLRPLGSGANAHLYSDAVPVAARNEEENIERLEDLEAEMKKHSDLTASGSGVDENPNDLLRFSDGCNVSREWPSLVQRTKEPKNRRELSTKTRGRTIVQEEVWEAAVCSGWSVHCCRTLSRIHQ